MADENEKQEKQAKPPKPEKQPKQDKQAKKGKAPKEEQPKAEAVPAEPVEPAPRARLWDFYDQQVRGKLQQQFGFKNPHQIPRLKKVVLNVGMGDASKNPKGLDAAGSRLAALTGQPPVGAPGKNAHAKLNLRRGQAIGGAVAPAGGRVSG